MDPQNVLDARTAFVTLLFLFSLRHSLFLMPIAATLSAMIAIKRMAQFFLVKELDRHSIERIPNYDSFHGSAVTCVGGNFSWSSRFSSSQALVLKNINLDVKSGELLGITGAVGCGKSSFLSSLLGLTERVSGHITLKGSVAYVSQQAWIQNMTLRDNILFGKPFQETRYKMVIDACALKPDLELLTSGDLTEIGEKGINLSGGQKLRITLARAVYMDSDIYFFDDPLSAVDAHVGKHIFENVIGPNGVLKGKTIIFVTNAIHWLPDCDKVVYLEQERISEIGLYTELVERDERFGDFLRQCAVEHTNGDDEISHEIQGISKAPVDQETELRMLKKEASLRPPDGNISQSNEVQSVMRTQAKGDGLKLISVEEFQTGGIKWTSYWLLCKEMTWTMSILTLLGYTLSNAFFLLSNLWVAQWCQTNMTRGDGTVDRSLKNYEVSMYAMWVILQWVLGFVGLLGIAFGMVFAGRSLHNNMLVRLMRAPMWYFDTTPLGRIVNRFSKDIDYVDVMIPTLMRFVLNSLFMCIVFVLLVVMVFPLLAAFVIPLIVVAYFVKGYYMSTTTQLKRLDVLSRSPLISSLQESMSGSNMIQAMKQGQRFITENYRKIDHLTSVILCSNTALHWLTLVLMFLANALTLLCASLAVFGRDNLGYDAKPAFVGLGLLAAASFTALFPWMVQNVCELDNALVSVERLREYSNAPVEDPAIVANYRPPAKWPYFGNITFTDYKTRYREGMDLVLDGITATIKSGEKIVVVGRTGSGKSTMTLALLRIIEPAGGVIYIDGTDISRIGLHDLRSRITIIPQESVLFSGTLRINLDPFDQFSDELIWKALESSRLKNYFLSYSHGLLFKISEGGLNLSVGQRQLICLARALLRRTKTLILDEATAAIDFETDKFVQEIIRQEFADCTVITIAHRINTIMDSTRILVMNAGQIREYDTPANLLENPNSLL